VASLLDIHTNTKASQTFAISNSQFQHYSAQFIVRRRCRCRMAWFIDLDYHSAGAQHQTHCVCVSRCLPSPTFSNNFSLPPDARAAAATTTTTAMFYAAESSPSFCKRRQRGEERRRQKKYFFQRTSERERERWNKLAAAHEKSSYDGSRRRRRGARGERDKGSTDDKSAGE
jgi:hypothetical protein